MATNALTDQSRDRVPFSCLVRVEENSQLEEDTFIMFPFLS